MEGFGIINFMPIPASQSREAKGITAFTIFEAYSELIPSMADVFLQEDQIRNIFGCFRYCAALVILRSIQPFNCVRFTREGGLHFIKTKVTADGFVMIFRFGSVIAQQRAR